MLVQVTKDPVGHKGARLTSQVSLPGRYLVYVPNGSMNGISRKLPDTERARLKKILKEVLPDNAGVIVRTAAEGATEEQLTLDVQRASPRQWADISKQVESVQAPALLHSEPDLLDQDRPRRLQRGLPEARSSPATTRARPSRRYLRQVAPDLLDRVERYEGDRDAFDEYRITEQIEKALDRKVWLPSGGSLVIDRTEAMTVVDVNTGKFVGSGGNLEETVTKNNLEAAEEIVRQLRLRDIGGIIVVDFIDMVLEINRDLVLRRLVECLSRDRTKHQVAEVTSLGLVQMTRKKLGLGLAGDLQRAVRGLRRPRRHRAPRPRREAPPAAAAADERRRGRGGQQRHRPAATAAAAAHGNGHAAAARTPSPTTRRTRSPRSRPATIAAHVHDDAAAADGHEAARPRRRRRTETRRAAQGEPPAAGAAEAASRPAASPEKRADAAERRTAAVAQPDRIGRAVDRAARVRRRSAVDGARRRRRPS